MKRGAAILAVLLAGCAAAPSIEEARLASPSPEVASCAQWFRALDEEIETAGVRDLQYASVPGFPYLRSDRFLAASLHRAQASASAFEALVDRMLEHDMEARRYEIANLPPARVEKWSGMGREDSRATALRRSLQCSRVLRDADLAAPAIRSALLKRAALPPSPASHTACHGDFKRSAGAVVRFSPAPGGAERAAVARWLARAKQDALGQPIVSERELLALAAAYAPSFELVVASDADRFGAVRWRRGTSQPETDPADPAVYVHRAYAYYDGQALLQVVYTMLFPEDRIAWRVTLAPDGEPLAYDASTADGCYTVALTPRARLRERAESAPSGLPRLGEAERPLFGVAAASHAIEARGVVRGTDSLARYALRAYDELRSAPGFDGRHRAAAGRPALDDGDRMASRFAFDLTGRAK